MTKSAKSLLVAVAVLMAGVVRADAPQIWMTKGSVVVWDAPDDPQRTGWNVVLAQSSPTNMPTSDMMRSQDTENTNRVIAWAIVANPLVTRFSVSTLLNNMTWQNGTVMISARDPFGKFSDWVGIEVYNPDPSNVRLK